VVTDNGNFVIDADFGEVAPKDVAALDQKIQVRRWRMRVAEFSSLFQAIVGVVETGLFVGIASKAFFGHSDGRVTTSVASRHSA